MVRRVAHAQQVSLVDLAVLFDEIPQQELESYFHEGDIMHPNALGSRLIAQQLASVINKQLQ